MNRSEFSEMMGKEHNNGSFERDSQLIQEEYNERQDNSNRLDSRSINTLATELKDIKVTENQENLPTFAFPTFDIQDFLFGDMEDLAETKINNQKTVDQYLAEQGLPTTTKMTLSNIPTGWVLKHEKDEAKDQDDDNYHHVAPGSPSSLSLLPVLGGMTHKNSPGKAGSTKKNARSHPYARRSSKKKQEKKERMRLAELPQSNADSSSTNGLDAEDGYFGAHDTDR